MSRAKRPYMTDINLILGTGVDPKTGLPLKMGGGKAQNLNLLSGIERLVRDVDLKDFRNRYKWINLPRGLTSQKLETMLYNRGQLAFFYMKENDKFYALPYALDGNLNVYGEYLDIVPLPYTGASTEKEQKAWIDGLTKHVEHDIVLEEEMTLDKFDNSCVLIFDYMPQYGQNCIPRSELNREIIQAEAECFPIGRTNLISNSGIKGMRVPDADCESQVNSASEKMYNAAMTGNPYMAIIGGIDFQELGGGSAMKSEEFMLFMNSLDNFRLSTLGLDNSGLFEKKAHILNSEQATNTKNIGLVLQDGLTIRQRACNIINSIWDLGIWCEISETVTEFDANMDGKITDEDSSQPQTNINTGGVEDDVV